MVCADAGGVNNIYLKANPFKYLQYSVAVLRDSDTNFKSFAEESAFKSSGGLVFKWAVGQAIEDAVFHSFDSETVVTLVKFADRWHGGNKVQENLSSCSGGGVNLSSFLSAIDINSREKICAGC